MKIEIKECGEYLELDKEGMIIPVASHDKIKERWLPLIHDFVEFSKAQHKDNLSSIFLRGSVAKGSDESGIADFDCLVIAKVKKPIDSGAWNKNSDELCEKYPFCAKVDTNQVSLEDIDFVDIKKAGNFWPKFIKTQAVCLYGEDFSEQIQKFSLREMIHYSEFVQLFFEEKFKEFIEEDKDDPEELKGTCSWGCRILLRSGYELVMDKEQRWTNDLYRCYEGLSKYYPEKKDLFYQTLNWALNCDATPEELTELSSSWIPWLSSEIKKQLEIDGSLRN